MRICRSHRLATGLIALLLTGTACQTAQRQAAILPPEQANAPALTAVAVVGAHASAPAGPPAEDPKPVPGPTAPQAKPDPIAELIAKSDKEYEAGQQSYKAGNLPAARESFDRALAVLGSQEYVLSDERLQHQFDKVLEALNSPGLQPTEEAESAEQKPEPAPIDEVNEVTPPVDANVKAQAEAEIKATRSDLPLMLTDQVAGYINYFSGRGRGTLERALIRSGRYQEMIQRTFKDEGVPQDLIYLAQAESGFHPTALSRAGARGMWQFMSSRARGYGLHRNLWVDERQDPEKATRAAARHLKDLYEQFGDWYLAMAAYNSGPGRIQSAVKRTGYADFWELYKRNVLPRETRNYVPIILAVTIMAKNPAQYDLDELVLDKPTPYETVKLDYPVDLRLVAQCIDASAGDVLELNPSLLRWTTPADRSFELRLPAGTKDTYLSAISDVPKDMRVWWRYHKVAPGDSLSSLARSYRTTPKAIVQTNRLDESEDLLADSKLLIPIPAGKRPATEDGATYARRATRYKVRRGDTVQSVADNFGVPAVMVRRWNHLKGNSLHGRRVVYVHLPVTPNSQARAAASKSTSKSTKASPVSHKSPVRHTVKPGETLYSIASSYNTSVDALKRDNGNLATLRPGMILLVRAAQ